MSDLAPSASAPQAQAARHLRDVVLNCTFEPLVELFEAAGCGAPQIVWRPGAASLRHPVLCRAFDHVVAASGPDGRLDAACLDSAEFGDLARSAMVLEPVGDGNDFRYAHYGADIAEAYGRDMTGALTSDFGGHITPFFQATYQAVMARGERLMTVHEPPAQVFVRVWRRLIVPVYRGAGPVPVRLLGFNVADNALRAGLDALPDPVFVVDGQGMVRFGNRAAGRMFGFGGTMQARRPLSEVIGTQVDLPAAPESLVRQGVLHASRKALVRHALLVPVRITVGATFYRHTPFYIVTVQPTD